MDGGFAEAVQALRDAPGEGSSGRRWGAVWRVGGHRRREVGEAAFVGSQGRYAHQGPQGEASRAQTTVPDAG